MSQVVFNVGSINIDHVYNVDHFAQPGETMDSNGYQVFGGGKGFNQSVALARAGGAPRHIGAVGSDGVRLCDRLREEGADTEHVSVVDDATGHAIIQVTPGGENAIVVNSGANHSLTPTGIASALASSSQGDYLLLQNETSSVAEAIKMGHDAGLQVVFNPAPMTPCVQDYPLHLVDIFVLNETEARAITGSSVPLDVVASMRDRFPTAATVLTMGRQGALYADQRRQCRQAAVAVEAVDTTAAGDTFIGYFLFELMQGSGPERALLRGCQAAALCVTREGASDSIPFKEELNSTDV